MKARTPAPQSWSPEGWTRVDRGIVAAREQLASANHEEDYQAVGLICRETLISLAQAVYDPTLHESLDGVAPSDSDAKRMLEAYVTRELAGGSNKEARKHATAALDLANTLVHKRTATSRDASLCAEATTSVINLIAIIFGGRDTVSKPQVSQPSLEKIINDAVARLRREPLFIRLNRILELLGLEQQWLGGKFTRAESGLERVYALPGSQGSFHLYAPSKKGPLSTFWYLSSALGQFNLDAQLADIRVLMERCSRGQNAVITFILVTYEDLEPLRSRIQRAFAHMKTFVPEEHRDLFSLELWDESVLTSKEKDLGLTL